MAVAVATAEEEMAAIMIDLKFPNKTTDIIEAIK